jgi:signal peptidase I
MTPFELLAIVAIIGAARAILSLRPVVAGSSGRSTAIAREFLDPFIIAGIAAWILITFVARTYYIPSGSMLPTLQIHDVLLVDKFEYRFHRPNEGDVVVFPPPVPTPDDFIKRVIGRPGDMLRIADGAVYIDGAPLREPYVAEKPGSARLRNLRKLWRGLAAPRSQRRERPAGSAVERAESHSGSLLYHARR